jgi:hypothetical protein
VESTWQFIQDSKNDPVMKPDNNMAVPNLRTYIQGNVRQRRAQVEKFIIQ